MPVHGGKLAARALKQAGVEVVFTLSGGHIMPLYDGCLDEGIRIIDVRHEQAAVHAADAWARCNPGKIGVAAITAGPGRHRRRHRHRERLARELADPGVRRARGRSRTCAAARSRRWTTSAWSARSRSTADAIYQTTASPSTSSSRSATRCRAFPGPAYLEIPMDVFMGQAEWEQAPVPQDPHRRRRASRRTAPRCAARSRSSRTRSARC